MQQPEGGNEGGRTADLRIIDLFAGIGGIRLGFERWGCRTVFSSEWDPDAQLMYEAHFGERPAGDITQIDPHDIPAHDILLAGFPCQPFSIIGKMDGFADTRGTLFFTIEEILRVQRPSAFMLENVKQLRTHDQGRTFRTILNSLHQLGYTTYDTVLNALDFGLPQKRERTFIVGFREPIAFRFPTRQTSYRPLAQVLEEDSVVDPRLWASAAIVEKRQARLKAEPFYPSIWHENKGGNISVLPYSCALRAGGSYNYLLVNGNRRPSPRELMRLQGFPDSYGICVNYSAMRKLTGNSVAVPVIEALARELIAALQARVGVATSQQLSLIDHSNGI